MTKLTTVKRKAKVGERILITNAYPTHDYNTGDIMTVADPGSDGVYAIEAVCFIENDEYEVVVVKPDTNRRLTEAEAKIAALEAEVKALKDASKPDFSAKAFDDAMEAMGRFAKTDLRTPNQRRADVIKRAQAFVADLGERAFGLGNNRDGNAMFNRQTTKLSFHVNAEKRVVTALAHGALFRSLYGKAFAKCAPGDVFNADIGKAVAAGRLYGVKVPKEFTDAVKPTYANGQIITFPVTDSWYRGTTYRIDDVNKSENNLTIIKANHGVVGGKANADLFDNSADKNVLPIIDDTDAVYL